MGEDVQPDVALLHRVAAAIQNGLYGHGGIDPGTAACYSAAEAVLSDLGLEHVGWHDPEAARTFGPNVHDFQWHDGWAALGYVHQDCLPAYAMSHPGGLGEQSDA